MKKIILFCCLVIASGFTHAQLSTCAAPGACARQLVVNGTFNDSIFGVNSALPYVVGCLPASYCIGNEPRAKCNMASWQNDLWDFNQGNANGLYMLIDGQNLAPGATTLIWQQNVPMVNGRNYVFSFEVMPSISTVNGNGQNLQVAVNGGVILNSNTGTYTATNLFLWNNRCVAFNYTGPTGIVPLTITQLAPQSGNGDYGIDNISLLEDQPVQNFTACANDNPFVFATPDSAGTFATGTAPAGSFIFTAGTPDNWSFDPQISGTGNFQVTISDSISCYAITTISVNPLPIVTTTLSDSVCVNSGAIPIGIQSGDNITFIFNGLFSPTTSVTGTPTSWFTPTNGLSMPSPTGAGPVTFFPSITTVGTNYITYNLNDGICTASVTGTIEVLPGPTLTFTPVVIDLCAWNGNPVPLGASSNGTSCSYSGVGIVDASLGLFDPILAGGVGTYAISYSCVDENGCSNKVSATVEVVENDFWHQTTKDAVIRDMGNDVVTDAQGNVYITGIYTVQTTFDGGGNVDKTITSGTGTFSPFSFVAKYDNCGSLEWVAYSVSNAAGHPNWGNSITLDETNGWVYAAGGFMNNIRYIGGDGSIASTSLANMRGYVAAFNMSNGHIHYVNPIAFNDVTDVTAITINKNTGKIYVGGYHSSNSGPGTDFAFAQHFAPTIAGIGPIVWQINATSNGHSYVNDMDYDENIIGSSPGNLWIIGDYYGTITWPSSTVVSSSTGRDAYVVRYVDGTTPTVGLLKKGNAAGASQMTGEGISVNSTNHDVYVTGDYTPAGILTPFQISGHVLGGTGGGYNAYFMAIRPNGTSPWPQSKYTESGAKMSQGKSVSNVNGQAFFAGWFNGATNFNGSAPLPVSLTYGGTGMMHSFVVGYNALTGAGLGSNWTNDPAAANAAHEGNSIATDQNGHAFITGTYTREMGYQYATPPPASGNLNSSGANAYNAYTMRMDLSNGHFRMTEAGDDETESEVKDVNGINVYPNPTNAQVTVDVSGFENNGKYTLIVYNSIGEMVKQLTLSSQQTMVDLSDMQNGIYLIAVNDGQSTRVIRVAKTN